MPKVPREDPPTLLGFLALLAASWLLVALIGVGGYVAIEWLYSVFWAMPAA